jgi:hypothetical protein
LKCDEQSQSAAVDPDVGASKILERPMNAIAIKKGRPREQAAMSNPTEMGTLRCDACGEEFVIYHDSPSTDKVVAARQAHWLEKVLADEHDRERNHPDRIQLPE